MAGPSDAAYFYLSYYGLERTVIEAQVLAPIRALVREGFPVRLIIFEGIGECARLARSAPRRAARSSVLAGVDATTFPRFPRNPFCLNSLVLLFLMMSALFTRRRVVVHARGFQGASVALVLRRFIPKLRVICDVRGMEADEYQFSLEKKRGRPMNAGERWWHRRLLRIASDALREADVVSGVSRSMVARLQADVPTQKKWIHVPCSVDVDRFAASARSRDQTRARLHLADRIVFVYSGALRAWQMPHATVTAFEQIARVEPRAFLLVLTPDGDKFEPFLKDRLREDQFSLRYAPFHEVPDILAAGDVGFLLREASPVNRYACPTKFGEYLAAGLHVLTTDAIDDVASVVRESGVGTIVGDPERLDGAEINQVLQAALESTARVERCVATARRHFDWAAHIPTLKKWYVELAR